MDVGKTAITMNIDMNDNTVIVRRAIKLPDGSFDLATSSTVFHNDILDRKTRQLARQGKTNKERSDFRNSSELGYLLENGEFMDREGWLVIEEDLKRRGLRVINTTSTTFPKETKQCPRQ